MDPPDYASDIFAETRRNLILALGMTEQEATDHLTAAWRQRNPRPNHENEQHAAQEQAPPPNQVEGRDPPPAPPQPADRKKISPKIHRGEFIPTLRLADPSEHALRKVRNHEYVELWYFTPKGCEAAAAHAISLETDTFTISKADSDLMLLPSRTSSLPKNTIIQDEHLTFDEMAIGKNSLISHMASCNWQLPIIRMFMDFYLMLDTHPIRRQPRGDQAILIYQAEARRLWHTTLAASKEHESFDISGINELRLQAIADTIRVSVHNQLINVRITSNLPIFERR